MKKLFLISLVFNINNISQSIKSSMPDSSIFKEFEQTEDSFTIKQKLYPLYCEELTETSRKIFGSMRIYYVYGINNIEKVLDYLDFNLFFCVLIPRPNNTAPIRFSIDYIDDFQALKSPQLKNDELKTFLSSPEILESFFQNFTEINNPDHTAWQKDCITQMIAYHEQATAGCTKLPRIKKLIPE